MDRLTQSINEYNKRLVKLGNDLFILTNNPQFSTSVEYIEHEIKTGKPSLFLFRHIDHADEIIFDRILVGKDINIFMDTETQHAYMPQKLSTELRACWSDLNERNQKVVFECVTNLFKIAKYVKTFHYDDLLRVTM